MTVADMSCLRCVLAAEETSMTDHRSDDDAAPAPEQETEEMEKVQEDAAREREENGGYQ